MKKNYIFRIIVVLLLGVIVFGINKYNNDTNRLKNEIGDHYIRAIVPLLKDNTNGLKTYLEENEILDINYLKDKSKEFTECVFEISHYYGPNKIDAFHLYGFNISGKLDELINSISENELKENQKRIREELISMLSKGQDGWNYIFDKIDNTKESTRDFKNKAYKVLDSPSNDFVDKINSLLLE